MDSPSMSLALFAADLAKIFMDTSKARATLSCSLGSLPQSVPSLLNTDVKERINRSSVNVSLALAKSSGAA